METKTTLNHEPPPAAKPLLGDVFPEGGIDLVGYNVEYWVRSPKHTFLAKGIIVKYAKKGKYGKGSYSGGVYVIKCGKRTFSKRRCEFTVVSKNIA
jgi:hypothetical protein